MQGRQGQGNDPWNRSSSGPDVAANGTGKQRTIPQRPPGMTRIDRPPQIQRVSRPQRQAQPPKSWRRRLLVLTGVLLVCALLAWGIGYALVNYFEGINNSAGAANTATNFLLALKIQNYDQAYGGLDANITISLTKTDFTKMAQADDHCYGPVTDFNEQQGSATISADHSTQGYTYDMTRSKLKKTYPLTLTLQKGSNGDWDITRYDNNDLGPAPPTCK